ncbi:MAG: carbon monoxide dehydrogenase subunit G [Anaerolineales bacterium]|nr:carbon monoxide dehydrogenase subunit G [Anaerolineales bacterium]
MHLEGTTTIKAARQVVWDFLTDPTQVAQCAPGVESVTLLEDGRKFQATAAVGFGSVKVRFTGQAEFAEMDPPNRAKITAHGSATGSAADVSSEMALSDAADGATELKWSADVAVVGQIASLAARMMAPISQKLTGLFFDEVRKRIEAPAAPAAGPVPPPAEAAGSAPLTPASEPPAPAQSGG